MKRNTINYRKLWESNFGKIPIDEYGRSYEIHHIDGNHKNNELCNLKCVSINEHYDIHFSQCNYQACMIISTRMNYTPDELKSKLKGLKRSDAGRLNIRNALLGRILSKSHKKSISDGLRGHSTSNETKQKISKSLNNHEVTEATRLKMSNSKKGTPAYNRISIVQLDNNDNVLCIWNSIAEASSTLKINNINRVLKGMCKFAGGFKWKYNTPETVA